MKPEDYITQGWAGVALVAGFTFFHTTVLWSAFFVGVCFIVHAWYYTWR